MKIHFRNIGSIRSLDFELKEGLTLLCGKNGTGKTYAAYVIFSILARFRETSARWLNADDLAGLFSQGGFELDLRKSIESDDFLTDISGELAQHLPGDFDAPKGFFGKDCIRIEDIRPQQSRTLSRRTVSTGLVSGSIKIGFELNNDQLFISLVNTESGDELSKPSPTALLAFINTAISELVLNQYLGRVHVLTAERAAINLFSRELSSSRNNLVDQLLALENFGKNEVNIRDFMGQKASRYSLPIRKGLEIAEDLKNIAKERSEFAAYADKLEEIVLGGKIQIGENGELIYLHNAATSLRINLAASMIKSLASLVVYLRHQATKGDLLIIDEPELNLHPNNQRKLALFLCELTNAGLDILISTHSDYIVREVNNAILLKHPSMAAVKAKHNYLDDQLMAAERVSVVLFNETGHPKKLVVDHKGFAVDSIDEEINLLNQIADDIEQDWQE
jgi:hypothetical protein